MRPENDLLRSVDEYLAREDEPRWLAYVAMSIVICAAITLLYAVGK